MAIRNNKFKALLMLTMATVLLTSSASYVKAVENVNDSANQSSTSQNDVEELFKKAMKERSEGRLESSILTFHDILSNDPLLHRARLELAVAYYQLLKYEESIAHAKKVAEDPTIPPNVRIAVLAFIAQSEKGLHKAGKRSEWLFPVSMGYIIDDNANVGPSSSILPSGTVVNHDSMPKSDNALEFNLGINHIYQTGKKFSLGSSSTMFYLLSGANLYDRNYFKEDSDLSVLSLRTGPALITQGQWRAIVNMQWDKIRYADKPLADFYTLTPSFTRHFPYALEATIDFAISKRHYGSDYLNRDNDYLAPRISMGYTSANKLFSVQFSAQYFDEDAEIDRYTNAGTSLYVGTTLNFSENTQLFVSYNRMDIKYDGFEPTFIVHRKDTQHRYIAGISHKISSGSILFDGWTVGLKTILTDNTSNVTTTDYDRLQSSLTLGKTF